MFSGSVSNGQFVEMRKVVFGGLIGLLLLMGCLVAAPALAQTEQCKLVQTNDGLFKKCDVYHLERVPQRVCENRRRYDQRRRKMVTRRFCRNVYSENRRWVRSYMLPMTPSSAVSPRY